jgi:methyltransferase (TIGR00027 family)
MEDGRSSTDLVSTAHWIAAVRARESGRPDRLFDDPYAAALAGPRGVVIRQSSERASGGENAYLPVRTRYFDDVLVRAVTDGGADQVVLLGAGLDTRAFRLPMPEHVRLFELDRAEILEEKEGILVAMGARARCARRVVPADLREGCSSELRAAGLDRGAVTVWVAEGLLFYLVEETVRSVLREAAALSPERSLFAADMFGTGVRSLPSMSQSLSWLERGGLPGPFATDDPAGLLASCGWVPERITSPGAPDANYGRFPTTGRPEHSPGQDPTRRAHLVTARR